MAARTSTPSLRQQEQTRAAIQTTQLVKRLQDYALAKKDAEMADIDAGRLKAIEILLRKSLPDLSSVALTGQVDHTHRDAVQERADKFTEAMRSLVERAEIKARPN